MESTLSVCTLTEQTPDGSFVVVPVLSSDGLLVAVRSWPMEKWEGRSEWNVSTEQTACDGLEALETVALDFSISIHRSTKNNGNVQEMQNRQWIQKELIIETYSSWY